MAAASGDASLVVTWDTPEDPGDPGDVITGYAVRWRPQPDDPCCPWDQAQSQQVGNVETYTITGLTNEQVYEVQVRAFNRLSGGIWSTPSALGTPAELQGTRRNTRAGRGCSRPRWPPKTRTRPSRWSHPAP